MNILECADALRDAAAAIGKVEEAIDVLVKAGFFGAPGSSGSLENSARSAVRVIPQLSEDLLGIANRLKPLAPVN